MNENYYDPCLREGEKVFLSYLYLHGAKYVVIGGHAVLLYSGDREDGVNDLDVVIECSGENAVKVAAAVHDYDPGLISEMKVEDLAQPNKILRITRADLIEVMTSAKSTVLSFDDLWRDRHLFPISVIVADLTEGSLFDVPIVSKAHLLKLKQEAVSDPERDEDKREQGRKDVEQLQLSRI